MKNLIKRTTSMLLMAMAILFGYSPQASAQTAQDKYLDIANGHESIGDVGSGNTPKPQKYYTYKEYATNKEAWLTMSVFGAYHASRYASNSWITYTNNSYENEDWGDSFPFLGGTEYFGNSTQRSFHGDRNSNTQRIVTFYVTNVTQVKLCGKGLTDFWYIFGTLYGTNDNTPARLQIYKCTKNANGNLTPANNTTVNKSSSSQNNFTLESDENALDAGSIYKVDVSVYRGDLYEIAFKTPLEVTAEEESIADFWQAPGYTHEKTFTLSAKNIKNSNVTINSSNPAFTVSPHSFTAAEAKEGPEVTITFNPQNGDNSLNNETNLDGNLKQDGQYDGKISIKYNNVEYDAVTVTGITKYFPVSISGFGATTLYYDQPLVVSTDVTGSFYVNSTANQQAIIEEIEDIIPSETGVIVEGNSGQYKFYVFNEADESVTLTPISGNYLKGTTAAEGITPAEALKLYAEPGSDSYIMTLAPGSNAYLSFYKFIGANLNQYKAFLVYKADSSAPVNSLSIGGIGEEYTAIEEVKKTEEDGSWYTLQGVRLNGQPTKRGIYLLNGKKVMVK